MAALPSYFIDFLSSIRLTQNQIDDLKTGHSTLRKRLQSDDDLKDIIVSTFLQGSYRRSTAVRPKNGAKSDVDIIVVTNLDAETTTPEEALDIFIPFLDKYYKDKYRKQGRSIGISLSYVDLDIVPTSAPSEALQKELESDEIESNYSIEDILNEYNITSQNDILTEMQSFFSATEKNTWKSEPLLIPDREAEKWDKTHPLEQIRWTIEKNKKCNSHYINVVKALKWWKKTKLDAVKHPKSYPLEHFIGDCCPDEINSVAEGIVLTLETIVNEYPTKPFLADRGVPEHDVFGRLSDEDYNYFYEQVCDVAKIAREAYDCEDTYDSALKWKEIFGSKFPDPPKSNSSTTQGFSKREEKTSDIPKGRFA